MMEANQTARRPTEVLVEIDAATTPEEVRRVMRDAKRNDGITPSDLLPYLHRPRHAALRMIAVAMEAVDKPSALLALKVIGQAITDVTQRVPQEASKDAMKWFRGRGFESWCGLVGVDPEYAMECLSTTMPDHFPIEPMKEH